MDQRVIRPALDIKQRPDEKLWDKLLSQTGLLYREEEAKFGDLVWCQDFQVLGLYRSEEESPLRLDLESQLKRLTSQKHSQPKMSQQPFYRAIGGKFLKNGLIWDVSAGSGRDFCQLLAYGATRLWAFERHPIVYALFYFEFQRLRSRLENESSIELKLFHADVTKGLQQNDDQDRPDVIYYDPMYPEKKKNKALSRQWMEAFKEIVGKDEDELECLESFLNLSKSRVVLKRPLKEKPLLRKPHAQFSGKTTRYDLYCP